jgi:hypothetical protein
LKKSEYDTSSNLQDTVWNYLNNEWGIIKNHKYFFFSSKDFIYVKDNFDINNK